LVTGPPGGSAALWVGAVGLSVGRIPLLCSPLRRMRELPVVR
jgi:hypothetical protein